MRFRDLLLILSLAALWGLTALLVRIASVDVDVVFITGARMTIAATGMSAFALANGNMPSMRTHGARYLFMGVINGALPVGLGAFAATRLPVGIAAILFAPTPLFAAIIAAVWLRERLSAAQISGILIGIGGVAVLVGWAPFEIDGEVALGIAAALSSCLCYGFATSFVRVALKGENSQRITTGQLIGAAVVSLPFALGSLPAHFPSVSTIVILLVFGLISTALAYLLFWGLFERIGAVRTQMVALLIPCFGVMWGVIFRGEPLALNVLIGLAIVLASLVLVTGFSVQKA